MNNINPKDGVAVMADLIRKEKETQTPNEYMSEHIESGEGGINDVERN